MKPTRLSPEAKEILAKGMRWLSITFALFFTVPILIFKLFDYSGHWSMVVLSCILILGCMAVFGYSLFLISKAVFFDKDKSLG